MSLFPSSLSPPRITDTTTDASELLSNEEVDEAPLSALSDPLLTTNAANDSSPTNGTNSWTKERYQQSSPLTQPSDDVDLDEDHRVVNTTSPLLESTEQQSDTNINGNNDNEWVRHFLTILSGTLALLHAGFVIGSYFGPWSDTYVKVSIVGQEENGSKIWNMLEREAGSVDVFQSNLKEGLSIFRSSHHYGILVLIIVTSIVMPCLFMIIQPPLIFGVHKHTSSSFFLISPMDGTFGDTGRRSGRSILDGVVDSMHHTVDRIAHFKILSILNITLIVLEGTAKLTLGIVLVQALLDIATTLQLDLGIKSKGLRMDVTNVIRGGLVSYLIGCTAGILVLTTLRVQLDLYCRRMQRYSVSGVDEDTHDDQNSRTSQSARGKARPPRSAFMFRWHKGTGKNATPKDTGSGSLETALSFVDEEESPPITSEDYGLDDRHSNACASPQQPARSIEMTSSTTHHGRQTRGGGRDRFKLWQYIILFESILFALLLLIPMYTLPLIRLEYGGLGSKFIHETMEDLTLLDIAHRIWTNGWTSETSRWIVILTTLMFYVGIIVLPIVSLTLALGLRVLSSDFSLCRKLSQWCCCSMTYRTRRRESACYVCYRLLRYFYPCANSTLFALALIGTAMCLREVGQYLLDGYGICHRLEEAVGGKCLTVTGTAMVGVWCCLIQGVALDILVQWTLWEFG